MDAFRTRKETIKATYTAAEAQTKISDAFSGLGKELGDVGQAIQRAEDKTQQLQARAAAVDELLASGALDDPTGLGQDDLTRELDALASTAQVDNELAALKASLDGGQPAGQLAAGTSTPAPGELTEGTFEQPPAPGSSQGTAPGENLR